MQNAPRPGGSDDGPPRGCAPGRCQRISSSPDHLLPALGFSGCRDLYISAFVRGTLKQFVGFIEHFQQPCGVRICNRTSCKQGAHLFRHGHGFILQS
jgi:hypothetical protein